MGHTPFPPPREAQNERAWPPGSQAGAPAGQAWATSDQHDRLLKGPLAPPRLPNTRASQPTGSLPRSAGSGPSPPVALVTKQHTQHDSQDSTQNAAHLPSFTSGSEG